MDLLLDQTYTDPESALSTIRTALQNAWPEAPNESASMPPRRTRHYLQLIVHEWIANLVRHATFEDPPRISLRVFVDSTCVQCEITDNSMGFDLGYILSKMKTNTSPFPEAGMGLRIIDACTDEVSYRSELPLLHRFAASIPYDHEPWMNVLF